jgi:hypothetical protein
MNSADVLQITTQTSRKGTGYVCRPVQDSGLWPRRSRTRNRPGIRQCMTTAVGSCGSFRSSRTVGRRESARRPTRRVLVEDLDDAVRFAICKDGVPIDDHVMYVLPSKLRRYFAIFDA